MRKTRILLDCALMFLIATPASGISKSGDVGARLVAMAKAALGGMAWDRLEVMHDAGTVVLASGQELRYEHWSSLHTLATRACHDGVCMIFNGRVAYDCADRMCSRWTVLNTRHVKYGAYLDSFGFFFPNRFPVSFRYKGPRAEEGEEYDVVEAEPLGLEPLEIWIDQSSHLIFRIVYNDGRQQTDYTGYRHAGAVLYPYIQTVGREIKLRSDLVRFERARSVDFSLPKSTERSFGR